VKPLILLALLTAALLPAQPSPSFEVASVKPSPPPSGRGMRIRMGSDPGRIDYNGASLKMLITRAYDVKEYQVSGPAWLDTERFDVTATMPRDTPKETVRLMLQNLLAERFHLKLHREKRDLPAYVLVVAKGGPKLKPAPPTGGGRRMIMRGPGKLEASGMDLDSFSDLIANFVGRPVLNETELKGSYDCTLEFTPEPGMGPGMMKMAGPPPEGGQGPAAPDSSGPSLFTALQEQLGLKLEGRKAPIDILVVDEADRVPTEN
jgi:uncharacterized protein (TIGR03435 family)